MSRPAAILSELQSLHQLSTELGVVNASHHDMLLALRGDVSNPKVMPKILLSFDSPKTLNKDIGAIVPQGPHRWLI